MFKRIVALLITSIITITSLVPTSFAEGAPRTYREYIRRILENEIGSVEGSQYDTLIVVNEDSLTSDGLCANGLAGASKGAIVTINESEQSYKDIERILEYGEENMKNVYIIGGTKAISNKFQKDMERSGYKCKRIDGKDRVETSIKIADEINKLINVKEYAIARAYKGDADAVSIAYQSKSRKMPILLSKDGESLDYDIRGKKVYAIGGEAVLSNSLVEKVNSQRLAGEDRYKTNAAIIKNFKINNICIVDGSNERLGIAILASCYSDQPALISEKSYKGHIKNKAVRFSYIPILEKKDLTLESIALLSVRGMDKYFDNLYKKSKLKKYDYVFYGAYYDDSPMEKSKYIKDYRKNYYPYTPCKIVKSSEGYWTMLIENKQVYYLVNKNNGKVYKYDEKKKIHKEL